jgi:inner membrane protein
MEGFPNMDTGTHILFGLGLGGLAMLDPAIVSHPHGPAAVLIATVAGSNAPDADTLFRMKSNAVFIRQHRGLSHSLPAIAVWTGAITWLVSALFPGVPWAHLAFWVLLSVVIHIFSDLFNAYGTQAYRPFSRTWVRWNIVPLFDPFIFCSHVAAILLWAGGAARPQILFPLLYLVLAAYYIWRTWMHRRVSRMAPLQDPDRQHGDRYTVLPAPSPFRWTVVRQSPGGQFEVGEWERSVLHWRDTLICANHPAIDASKNHPDVAAFLVVTPFPCASVKLQSWGYEVRWVDVRFRNRRQYPFMAMVMMDFTFVPLQSYVGWLSADRLEKRLHMNTY